MEHLEGRQLGKSEQVVWHLDDTITTTGEISNVDKIRGYYDEARNRLRSYLGREDGMGSGSSSPKVLDSVGGEVMGLEGEAVFQQRPPHIRLEGKTEKDNGEQFTDISYSDLGFIITPQSKKLTINNNNYENSPDSSPNPSSQHTPSQSPTLQSTEEVEHDCDIVSSEVEGGNNRSGHNSSNSNSSSSSGSNNSNNSTSNGITLQHRSSNSSFTMSQQLPGAASHEPPPPKNLNDLTLEEISS